MSKSPIPVFRFAPPVAVTLWLMACPDAVFAQGTVLCSNRVANEVVTHVYFGGDHQIAGNGPTDYPSGARDWTGFTALVGTGYTAQLWCAPGADQPESSLQPTAPTTTFVTVAGFPGFLVDGYYDYAIAFDGGYLYIAWADNSNSAGGTPDSTCGMDIYVAKVNY